MVTRETAIRSGLERLGIRAGPDAAPRLARFHDLLLEVALPSGFLGPREADRLLERHLLESAALVPALGATASFVDVGSGAGLPGVVLACLAGSRAVLLEAEGRRAAFLERCRQELDLPQLEVVRGRAEEAGRSPALREALDAAVARALAPVPVALELLLPFVRPGGRALIAVGPTAQDELSAAAVASEALGAGPPELLPLEVPGLEAARWVMIVSKTGPCPERYPRRVGVPARRPLGGGRP